LEEEKQEEEKEGREKEEQSEEEEEESKEGGTERGKREGIGALCRIGRKEGRKSDVGNVFQSVRKDL
jgi:hypothetical protein